jgi:hypothetical protein
VRIRHCLICHEDYRPEIVRCAECGALLEDRDDDLPADASGGRDPATAEERDLPEGFEPIHTTRDLDDLPPLADGLIASGIDCRIREAHRNRQIVGYRLFVHAKDRVAAATTLQTLLRPHVETEFDPERGYARCPACDRPLQPRAAECPECGLPLVAAEETCPECGAAVDAGADHCGTCGHALSEPA